MLMAAMLRAYTSVATIALKKCHLTRRSNIVPLRSTGQNLSSFFVVLLRKIFPQKNYLNSAVYRNVRHQ
jgi:hypothetical protein